MKYKNAFILSLLSCTGLLCAAADSWPHDITTLDLFNFNCPNVGAFLGETSIFEASEPSTSNDRDNTLTFNLFNESDSIQPLPNSAPFHSSDFFEEPEELTDSESPNAFANFDTSRDSIVPALLNTIVSHQDTTPIAQSVTSTLDRSSRRRPRQADEKPFSCPYEKCTKAFTIKSNLTVHLQRHVGEKPFSCSYEGCTQAFVTKGDLTSHIKSHTDERPFSCSYEGCTQSFKRKSHLYDHLKSHTGEKPYACSYKRCTKAFSRKCDLNRHTNTHTNKKQRSE